VASLQRSRSARWDWTLRHTAKPPNTTTMRITSFFIPQDYRAPGEVLVKLAQGPALSFWNLAAEVRVPELIASPMVKRAASRSGRG